MNKDVNFKVEESTTLLPFLQKNFAKESRNYVKALLTRGQIKVNNKIRTHHAYPLKAGDTVMVTEKSRADVAEEKKAGLTVPILYEDAEIVAIDKPHGMLSISTEKEQERTAYHIVTDHVKEQDRKNRIFIVHRLDRETSGIMIFARSEQTKTTLQDNWDEMVSHRGYIAVVEGKPDKDEGRIVSWLKQTKTLLVYSSGYEGEGKKAITNYKTLQANNEYALLEISLETGRKNQIRVHMNDISHPVTGDKKYGAKSDPLKRVGLHASKLTFTHPATNEHMTINSPPPKGFARVTQGGIFV